MQSTITRFTLSGPAWLRPAAIPTTQKCAACSRVETTPDAPNHRKTDFQEVNPQGVLEKLAALPVRQWRYTNEDAEVKHLGPTAQDFQAAFGLGTDDKSIGTVDADGVALAAIQALNRKVEDRNVEIQQLKQRLEHLERLLATEGTPSR